MSLSSNLQIKESFQNLSISSFKAPENDIKPILKKDSLPISFYLKDIYSNLSKETFEERTEPLYEEMRKKFQNLFDKKLPNMYVRVPYYKVLIGDQITNIFDDKIITTLDKDLIICIRETDEDSIKIELFDEYYPSINIDLEKIRLEVEEKNYFENPENSEILNKDFIKYIYKGYKYATDLIIPKKKKGLNILVYFNCVNCNVKNKFSEKAKLMNLFTSVYLATFKIYDYLQKISKKDLLNFLWEDINKVENFANEYAYLLAIFFLEPMKIGLYFNKVFSQISIGEDMGLLVCDSLTPAPPTFYSQINYWNKRKIEYRLAVAIILKKIKS